MKNILLATIIGKCLAYFDGCDVYRNVVMIRRKGNIIHHSVKFGRRVQFYIDKEARITIKENSEVFSDCLLISNKGNHLQIDENVFISHHCNISGNIRIGANTLIGGYVTIIDTNHVFDDPCVPIRMQGGEQRDIIIGNDVWIGTNSIVLPGVRIGDHAVIGALSVVTKEVPEWCVSVGNPARVIRMREH